MAETESITVADVSDGPCASGQSGTAVDLPVVELLTGRGFVTGKSGSGKSNTASVVAEKLLDNGFGLLIVDIDGEYYGLKEEYEILHVGADDECDIEVTVEHAEKIATLALEKNVPIILDVSSFLDEDEARDLLTGVAKRLFAKAKKLKQPFLLLVEECHEYIPQQGSVGECGKMLIKISKRGRKHGLGVVGISQRPADVKKDFITQCDWLVWHRLTWNNDTKVVSRILDSDYAAAVEDLDDGEAFMMTDWSEQVRRVQFHRKRTFDAGATPGLDDFERPDLKSVSEDLVSELEEISEEKTERENRVAELREELDRKHSRIAELEAELQDARDMQRMADQFTAALVDHVKGANPGRTEQERMRERRQRTNGEASGPDEADAAGSNGHDDISTPVANGHDDTIAVASNGHAENGSTESRERAGETAGPESDRNSGTEATAAERPPDETARTDDGYDDAVMTWSGDEDPSDGSESDFFEAFAGADAEPSPAVAESASETKEDSESAGPGGEAFDVSEMLTRGFDGTDGNPLGDRAVTAFERGTAAAVDETDDDVAAEAFVDRLLADVAALDPETRQMLGYYRDHGPGTPMDALFAGGDEDRTAAYARNRRLRVRGLVEHVGRGQYDYRVPRLLDEHVDEAIDAHVDRIEQVFAATADADDAARGAD